MLSVGEAARWTSAITELTSPVHFYRPSLGFRTQTHYKKNDSRLGGGKNRERMKGQTEATDAAVLVRITAKTESHVISHPVLFLHLKVVLHSSQRHPSSGIEPSPPLPVFLAAAADARLMRG